MATITIIFLSLLSDLINTEEIIVELSENSTVKELIVHLHEKIGEKFKERILTESHEINNYVILVVNGKDIRTLDGFNTVIHDNDKISFLPALAGG